ncbi:MAG TPA: HEAT repeat domain-containing protein, partial [Desulfatiglandales bacterium]|nr:HEAT repeat domain-containing protein [Desulfatiglandales bacterium]
GEAPKNAFLSIAEKTAKQGRYYYFRKEGELYVTQKSYEVPRGTSYSEHMVHPHTTEILIHALDKADTKAITEILDIIWKFHDEDIAPALIKLLNNNSPLVRRLSITRLYGFTGRKALPYIINALNDTNPQVREKTIEMIGIFQDKQALEPLLKRLNDTEPNVREVAVRALGQIKEIKSIDPLIEMLSDENINVRKAALQSLGEFDEPRVYDINIKMLEDKSPDIRRIAIKNIIKRPDKKAIDSLILLFNDSEKDVRLLAAEALGEIGGERAVDELINLLNAELNRDQGGRNINLCKKAVEALAKIGDKRAIPHITKALEVNDLITTAKKALKSFEGPGEEQRPTPVLQIERPMPATVGEKGYTSSIMMSSSSKEQNRDAKQDSEGESGEEREKGSTGGPVILSLQTVKGVDSASSQMSDKAERPVGLSRNMMYSSQDQIKKAKQDAERESAERRAKDSTGAVAVQGPQIDNGADSSSSQISAEAEQPAGSGRDESVQDMISSLKNKDKNVRQDAARKLGERKAKDAAGAIINNLNDPDIDVRVALIWALGEINDPKAVKSLASLIKDSNGRIRTSSFTALGKIEDHTAREALINALAHRNDYRIRLEAADTLGDTGAREAVPNLIVLLDDKNEYIRQAASRALGGLKKKDAVEPLLQRLDDQDLHVRICVIQSLNKINDTRAVEPLLALALSEEDKEVHSLSIEALKKFKDPNAKEIMKRIFFEEYDSDIYQDRKKAEMILSIIGKKSTLQALQDPEGDDQKTISNYIKLMMTPPSSPFIELGEKALMDFKNRESVVAEISNLIKANKIDPKNRPYGDNNYKYISLLRNLKDLSCIPTFIHVLENRKDYQAWSIRSACGALGDLNYSEGAPLIREIMVNPVERSYVRMDAVEALGKIGDKEAVPAIIDIIKNRTEDKDLRKGSINALRDIKDNRAVEPLINVLKDADEDIWLRAAAAEALGNIGDQKAISPLEEAIKDPKLKQTSQNALKKLQSKD